LKGGEKSPVLRGEIKKGGGKRESFGGGEGQVRPSGQSGNLR